MPRSLVTGGAGFIGSNLVDKLIETGHEVVCVDNESSMSTDMYHWNPAAENHKIDICSLDEMDGLFRGVDFVFHLAAESRIGLTMENPVKAFMTNAVGTAKVLQCARTNGVKRVMYSSTSSAYGNNPSPNRESQPDDGLNPYSVSKLAGEKACHMYSRLFGLNTVIFRYFNIYGPREPRKGQYAPVIGIFARQRAAGEPLTVVGDGLQRRDFTHVNDVVNANILAATKEIPEEFIGTVFNVGTGRNHSILELANMMSDNISFIPERPGEMRETLADKSKIRKVLGWEPTVQLEDYIDSLIR
jgi:UDP-glucose 4-epimerase